MFDGQHAHNAWLQELPDPITKVTWDNYAQIAPSLAEELAVETGDLVRVSAAGERGGPAIELPALIQPGQAPSVIGVALGYGRLGTDRFTDIGPKWLHAQPTVDDSSTVGVTGS